MKWPRINGKGRDTYLSTIEGEASLAAVRDTLNDLDIGSVPSGDDNISEGASQFSSQAICFLDQCNIYDIANSLTVFTGEVERFIYP